MRRDGGAGPLPVDRGGRADASTDVGLADRLQRGGEARGGVTGCGVADIHARFLGHGLTEPDPPRRWYWDDMIIEPNARGASEVRRLWLRAVGS